MAFLYVLTVIIVSLPFGFGLYMLLNTVKHMPTSQSLKIIDSLNKKSTSFKSIAVYPLAERIAKIIHVHEPKRSILERDLKSAGLTYSPEFFIASSLVYSVYGMVFAAALIPVSKFSAVSMAILSILWFFYRQQKTLKQVRRHRSAVIYEVPQLTRSVQNSLQRRQDIYTILSSYRDIAKPDMKMELNRLLVNMKNGNREKALIKFAGQFNSDVVTLLIRGLIGLERGEDMGNYFSDAESQMKKWIFTKMEIRAEKRPSELFFSNVLLLLAIISVAAAGIVTQVIEGLSAFH